MDTKLSPVKTAYLTKNKPKLLYLISVIVLFAISPVGHAEEPINRFEEAVVAASAYCFARNADAQSSAIYTVRRDYSQPGKGKEAKCGIACKNFAKNEFEERDKGTEILGSGLGEIGCKAYEVRGRLESLKGRPDAYYQSGTPQCDFCCCILK